MRIALLVVLAVVILVAPTAAAASACCAIDPVDCCEECPAALCASSRDLAPPDRVSNDFAPPASPTTDTVMAAFRDGAHLELLPTAAGRSMPRRPAPLRL